MTEFLKTVQLVSLNVKPVIINQIIALYVLIKDLGLLRHQIVFA